MFVVVNKHKPICELIAQAIMKCAISIFMHMRLHEVTQE